MDEKLKILKMVEEGKISSDEAHKLLEALEPKPLDKEGKGRWLKVREKMNPKSKALFISYESQGRLSRNGAYNAVVKYAKKLGFHNSESSKLQDHFGPHCFRHWFTTWLIRNGMPREYVKELRGDVRREAIDLYHHIDKEQLRLTYLACIPKLGT